MTEQAGEEEEDDKHIIYEINELELITYISCDSAFISSHSFILRSTELIKPLVSLPPEFERVLIRLCHAIS